MRVLFLDIDGVLNSMRTCTAFGGWPHRLQHIQAFDQVAIRLLQRLCDSSGVQIVLSSAWRGSEPIKAFADAFGLPIISETPHLLGQPRGAEIAAWLAEHPEVDQFAIIDDDPDMLPEQLPRFIQTDAEEGMSWANFRALCLLFNESPMAGEPRHRNWRAGVMQPLNWSET